jgi:hypothetical protein
LNKTIFKSGDFLQKPYRAMLESSLAGQPVLLHKRSTTMGIVNNESAAQKGFRFATLLARVCEQAGWLGNALSVSLRPSLSLSYSTRVQHTRGCLPSEV